MSFVALLTALLMYPTVTPAQNTPPNSQGNGAAPYVPVVPSPSITSSYGGWPSYTGTTVAGSAMNGMANVISAQGDYNLATSAAAVNMTQAQRQEIQNRQQATHAYFEMRATNRAARAKERGPHPTMEQLARLARDGMPDPFGPDEMDPISGKLAWPSVLKEDQFSAERNALDHLTAKQAYQHGLSFSDQMNARQLIEKMYAEMKRQIKNIPPQQYIDSKNFLSSMIYALCKSGLN